MTPAEEQTSLANLKLERDAIVLYDRLAAIERDPRRAAAFRGIASNERRHAAIWQERLEQAGVKVPPVGPARPRIRFILLVARLLGTRAVSGMVQALEGDEESEYLNQDDPVVASIIDDERQHAQIWQRLKGPVPDVGALRGAATGTAAGASSAAGAALAPAAEADEADIAAGEPWHRAGQSGALRAAIFGVSDGLVSNLSLVMGVVGAKADNHVVVLAGVAGLLAGSLSMGAGEWISMTSQRELFERQIGLEREELKIMPDEEEHELARIYRRKGLPPAEAAALARRLMVDPEAALDTLVREELGLDPDQLGSPWTAAISSMVAFAAGAFVPLAAFLVSSGTTAFVAAVTLSLVGLFAVGGGVSLLTGRSVIYSGVRQVIIGAAAATVTFFIGLVIGVQAG